MKEASLAKRVGGLGKAGSDAVGDLSGSVRELKSAVTENLDVADAAARSVISATERLAGIATGRPLGRVPGPCMGGQAPERHTKVHQEAAYVLEHQEKDQEGRRPERGGK